MGALEAFLEDLDRRWKPDGAARLRLGVIGSAALMLQTDYERGTKDGDVLETDAITPDVKERLLAAGGKGSEPHRRHRLYLDIVVLGLPFLPQRPVFHRLPRLRSLRHIEVEALDVVDVVVSKLIRFSASDDADARAMATRGLLEPKRLATRFRSAAALLALDARAGELPRIVRNLHLIERDYLGVPPTEIDLPDWSQRRQSRPASAAPGIFAILDPRWGTRPPCSC